MTQTGKRALATGASRGIGAAIANAFLASPKTQYITGATLTIDGGANA
jgi:NAD(P)-dependent dehydrogenase (short-subunit alcohol dehydrogenase family)